MPIAFTTRIQINSYRRVNPGPAEPGYALSLQTV